MNETTDTNQLRLVLQCSASTHNASCVLVAFQHIKSIIFLFTQTILEPSDTLKMFHLGYNIFHVTHFSLLCNHAEICYIPEVSVYIWFSACWMNFLAHKIFVKTIFLKGLKPVFHFLHLLGTKCACLKFGVTLTLKGSETHVFKFLWTKSLVLYYYITLVVFVGHLVALVQLILLCRLHFSVRSSYWITGLYEMKLPILMWSIGAVRPVLTPDPNELLDSRTQPDTLISSQCRDEVLSAGLFS